MPPFEPLEFNFSEIFDVLAEVRGAVGHLGSGMPDPQHRGIVQTLIDEIKASERAIESETLPAFKEMQEIHQENHRVIMKAEADFAELDAEREKLIREINERIANLELNPESLPKDKIIHPVISSMHVLEFSPPAELVAWVLASASNKDVAANEPTAPSFPRTTGHIWQNWNLDSFNKKM
jgi:hypothetical protein